MKKRMFLSLCLVAIALVTLGASNSCNAPMDATGEYSGIWSFKVKVADVLINTVDCDCTMSLNQDVTLDPPANLNITGTINVATSCLEESGLWPDGLPVPPFENVDITGTMNSINETIILVSGPLDTGVGTNLVLNGPGESDNPTEGEIPEMTGYSGNWDFVLSFIVDLPIDGTFDVTRVVEE